MLNIVIVGGSFSAIGTAHRILKEAATKPTLGPYKITLVSRDSHFYWNLAATRATVEGKIQDDEIFQPIAKGFHQYGDRFDFLLGSLEHVDTATKSLRVKIDGKTRETTLGYDILILASGTHTRAETPYKSKGSTLATKQALHELQSRVTKASSIVIAGAGPTGVELAGELADAFGSSKKIILITSKDTILDRLPARMAANASHYLGLLGVDVRVNCETSMIKETADCKTEITLALGDKLRADLYIPTYGVTPNTSFLSEDLLDKNGFVKVNDTLNVLGAENVFAIGEVSNFEAMNFLSLEAQSKHMAKNVILAMSGKQLLSYKKGRINPSGFYVRGRISFAPADQVSSGTIGVCVSKNYATGHLNGIPLPSFVLIRLRRVFFMDWLKGRVDGSGY